MRHTMTMLEEHNDVLLNEIFGVEGNEGAAFLRCGISSTPDEVRLLVRAVEPVRADEYLIREPLRLSIASTAYARAAKRAAAAGEAVVFVHSHPTGIADFSAQDDREEPKLMGFLRSRLGDGVPVGSLVVSSQPTYNARVWNDDGSWTRMDLLRVVGDRFRFFGLDPSVEALPQFFDRQIQAFGRDIQRVLRSLTVGVVGVGGTGSAVVAQLIRLGIGTIYIFDGQRFEGTNVNRVYGSGVADVGRLKTDIQEDAAERIGLKTRIVNIGAHITDKSAALRLRECDLIFGCTDLERPRGILGEVVTRYLVPVFDVGVVLQSTDEHLKGVFGRVTTLLPGEACLFCRGRITPERITAEGLPDEERRQLAQEGYAPELDEDAPAVIAFTTAVAAQGVSELIHRLTGFMGEERRSSEVLMFLHESSSRTNRRRADPDCGCGVRALWGSGDERDYLGLMWGGESA